LTRWRTIEYFGGYLPAAHTVEVFFLKHAGDWMDKGKRNVRENTKNLCLNETKN
jgi:hypothetical protein